MKIYNKPQRQRDREKFIFYNKLYISASLRLFFFILILAQSVFAASVKGKISYYDSIPYISFSLSNSIVKEKRQNPKISFDFGVMQKKDDFGISIGGGLKRKFLQCEGQVSSSYIFMKNDDIVSLELLITDPRTSKISLLYEAFLEAKRKESLLFIGPGVSYEISPSWTTLCSIQFGHSLRYVLGVMYK